MAQAALEVFELILQSDLYMSFLSPVELKFLLQRMVEMAMVSGHVDLFRFAVAYGADANETIRYSLVVNSSYPPKSVHFVEILQESGIFIMQQNNLNLWPMLKNADMALALIQLGLDMNGEPGRDSKIHRAIHLNDFKTVEVLVKHGYADLSARGDDELTPLMTTVTRQAWSEVYYLPIASFLVANGADMRQRGKYGRTVLHLVTNGCVLKDRLALLAHDPGLINVPDNKGRTPLHFLLVAYAYMYETEDLEVLLASGTDPYIQDREGESAYDQLMKNERGRAYVASHPHYFPRQSPHRE